MKISFRILFLVFIGLILTGLYSSELTDKASKINLNSDYKTNPNILVILSDQQHWQAMGFMDPFFDTPHLDAFARDAVVFENAFCTTPQCSPSRSSFLTGFYPTTTEVTGNIASAGGTPLSQQTIGKELQSAGYFTGYFGKWHLGSNTLATDGWSKNEFKQNDLLAERNAIQFLKEIGSTDKPFALFVSMLDPHDIYNFKSHKSESKDKETPLPLSWENETFQYKPRIQKQFMLEDQGKTIEGLPKDEWQKYRECYRDKTKLYDSYVGNILDELKIQGKLDNTIIIITSDHGDMDTNHKLIYKGPFMYEHMMRIPLMIQVPKKFGMIHPQRIKDIDIVNVDIAPTIRDFCNLPNARSHGKSFEPLLRGSNEYQPRDFVIGQYFSKQKWVNPIRMIRTKEYKLNRHISHGDELYNLKNDPHELINLINDKKYTAVKKDLTQKLNIWIKTNNDPFYSLKITDRFGKVID